VVGLYQSVNNGGMSGYDKPRNGSIRIHILGFCFVGFTYHISRSANRKAPGQPMIPDGLGLPDQNVD